MPMKSQKCSAKQPARQRLKTLRVAKKHFDLALGSCFQTEKIQVCPQFCPHWRGIYGRSRLAISEACQGGRRWLSVLLLIGSGWERAGLSKDQLIRSRSTTATPIGCVRPNICIRVIGLLGLEVSTEPVAIQEVERQLTVALRQRLSEAAQVSSDDFGFVLDER